jgi:hypothetical protein
MLILFAMMSGYIIIAQTPSVPLTITSPSNGAVVIPGQTINVTVTRAPNSGITAVALNAFDWTPIQTGSDPLVFSITVPTDTQPGPASISAFDMTPKAARGVGTTSAPVVLTVRSPPLVSLQPDVTVIHFQFVGDTYKLTLNGTPSSGNPVWLANSTSISFSSQVPSVASVDQTGLVTALGSGQTTIIAIFTNASGSKVAVNVPVFVPTLIRGDLNGDGKVDLEDLNVIQAAINTPATGPNDARDLNHDGVINALDSRILTTLCTYSRCATHP